MYFPRTAKVYAKFSPFYSPENEQMSLTTLVALSWTCFILSLAIFSSLVGDIDRLTAADTPSLDSSGLFICKQQNQDILKSVLQRMRYRRPILAESLGECPILIDQLEKTTSTSEYSRILRRQHDVMRTSHVA